MKAKLIYESLRDKLVGPTKESIDKHFYLKYGNDVIDYITNKLKPLEIDDYANPIYYKLNNKIYLEYYLNNMELLIDFSFELHLTNILKHKYNCIFKDNELYDLIKYIAKKILNIQINEVYPL